MIMKVASHGKKFRPTAVLERECSRPINFGAADSGLNVARIKKEFIQLRVPEIGSGGTTRVLKSNPVFYLSAK